MDKDELAEAIRELCDKSGQPCSDCAEVLAEMRDEYSIRAEDEGKDMDEDND